MTIYKVGEKVAWDMIDENVMAGTVTFVGFTSYNVTRVDGGSCTLPFFATRKATPEDVLAACDFYTKDWDKR